MYADPMIEDQRGDFRPPNALGRNRKRRGAGNHLMFQFDGSRTHLTNQLPSSAEMYKEYSIYYADGRFWTVDYDATLKMVGDGDDGSTTPENVSSGHDGVETNESSTDSSDYDGWCKLSFSEAPDTTTQVSYAGRRKRRKHLLTQRLDQIWVDQILPDAFHARPRDHTVDRRYGGLVGELPLLIGLMAMSVRPDQVHSHLPWMIRYGSWQAYPPNQIARLTGWDDGRGMVIKVFHDPTLVSQAQIDDFENGRLGRILE